MAKKETQEQQKFEQPGEAIGPATGAPLNSRTDRELSVPQHRPHYEFGPGQFMHDATSRGK